MITYYIDNYISGCQRDIRGPYPTLETARAKTQWPIEVSVEAYDGIVQQLEAEGGKATVLEAWAPSEDSEDCETIYAVEIAETITPSTAGF